MSRAYIALGSNLQSPQFQINKAFDELDAIPLSRVIKKSSLYNTVPVGYEDQPDFINAVVALDTKLDAEKLLMYLLAIENLHGRRRPFPNAPRQLDLDLLLYDNLQMETPDLTIPHPRMHTRSFVLLPLAEIAPDLKLPSPALAGKTVAELAAALPDQGVTKISA
jgi:2-amino-4-hydroxy-6-hydroxymethyldihydropteridine diphosphokinase